jgi:hypothetical protein
MYCRRKPKLLEKTFTLYHLKNGSDQGAQHIILSTVPLWQPTSKTCHPLYYLRNGCDQDSNRIPQCSILSIVPFWQSTSKTCHPLYHLRNGQTRFRTRDISVQSYPPDSPFPRPVMLSITSGMGSDQDSNQGHQHSILSTAPLWQPTSMTCQQSDLYMGTIVPIRPLNLAITCQFASSASTTGVQGLRGIHVCSKTNNMFCLAFICHAVPAAREVVNRWALIMILKGKLTWRQCKSNMRMICQFSFDRPNLDNIDHQLQIAILTNPD